MNDMVLEVGRGASMDQAFLEDMAVIGLYGGDRAWHGKEDVGDLEEKDTLKAVPVTLPALPPQEGREAGIVCGDLDGSGEVVDWRCSASCSSMVGRPDGGGYATLSELASGRTTGPITNAISTTRCLQLQCYSASSGTEDFDNAPDGPSGGSQNGACGGTTTLLRGDHVQGTSSLPAGRGIGEG